MATSVPTTRPPESDGWRAISAPEPFEAVPHNDPQARKYIELLTDGANAVLYDDLLPRLKAAKTISMTSRQRPVTIYIERATQGDESPIAIFTITFGNEPENITPLMSGYASKAPVCPIANYYSHAPDGRKLEADFGQIGAAIRSVRLTR